MNIEINEDMLVVIMDALELQAQEGILSTELEAEYALVELLYLKWPSKVETYGFIPCVRRVLNKYKPEAI